MSPRTLVRRSARRVSREGLGTFDVLSPQGDLLPSRGVLGCVVFPTGDGAAASCPGHLRAEGVVELAAEHVLVLVYAGEGFLEGGDTCAIARRGIFGSHGFSRDRCRYLQYETTPKVVVKRSLKILGYNHVLCPQV